MLWVASLGAGGAESPHHRGWGLAAHTEGCGEAAAGNQTDPAESRGGVSSAGGRSQGCRAGMLRTPNPPGWGGTGQALGGQG